MDLHLVEQLSGTFQRGFSGMFGNRPETLKETNLPHLVLRSSWILFTRSAKLSTAHLGVNCVVALNKSFKQIVR